MRLPTLVTSLVLLTSLLVSGCHRTAYRPACYTPAPVLAASPVPCPPPCPTPVAVPAPACATCPTPGIGH